MDMPKGRPSVFQRIFCCKEYMKKPEKANKGTPAIPPNTVQCHTIPCNTITTMQYPAIPCNILQYHAMSCNSKHYDAITQNFMQYHAIDEDPLSVLLLAL